MLICVSILIIGISYATEEIVVTPVKTKPNIDGILNDPCWNNAKEIIQGNLKIKACYDKEGIYFGIISKEEDVSQLKSTIKKRDDKKIVEDDFILLKLIEDTKTYLVIINSEGTIYDSLETKEKIDLSWDTNAKSNKDIDKSIWSIEVNFPRIKEGKIAIQRKDRFIKEYTLKFESVSIILSKEDLKNLTEEELKKIALEQAKDPSIIEKVNIGIDIFDKFLSLICDSKTFEEFQEKEKKLIEQIQKQWPNLEWIEEMKEGLRFKSNEEFIIMQNFLKLAKPHFDKETHLQHSLVNSYSLGEFISNMENKYGKEKAFSDLQRGPKEILSGSGFSLYYSSSVGSEETSPSGNEKLTENLDPNLKDLPDKWENLTEEQYSKVRTYYLSKFTDAAKELDRRKGTKEKK
jgi:hypothetical protein